MKHAGSFRISGSCPSDRHADPGDFFLQKVRLPGEREVLRRIDSLTEDTGWQERIGPFLCGSGFSRDGFGRLKYKKNRG